MAQREWTIHAQSYIPGKYLAKCVELLGEKGVRVLSMGELVRESIKDYIEESTGESVERIKREISVEDALQILDFRSGVYPVIGKRMSIQGENQERGDEEERDAATPSRRDKWDYSDEAVKAWMIEVGETYHTIEAAREEMKKLNSIGG